MFALSSTVDMWRERAIKAEASAMVYLVSLEKLRAQWEDLVGRVNAKGGERFLRDGRIAPPQLTREEIEALIRLCHPDKHGGRKSAEDMTKRLLALRDRTG